MRHYSHPPGRPGAYFWLELLLPLHDPLEKPGIEWLVSLQPHRSAVEQITRPSGIVPLRGELLLPGLEGAGDLETSHDQQEHGTGIIRQLLAKLMPE